MSNTKNYDDYPKIWTNNSSKFLSNSKKRKLNHELAETIKWAPISEDIKDELESIKIDINLTGDPKKEVYLYTLIDNIHYTDIPKPHITVEFNDRSSFNYFINDKDDNKRIIPVQTYKKTKNDKLAYKLIETRNFYKEKDELLNILSNIINSNEFRKYFGYYYEKAKNKEKQKTRRKPKLKPKKQKTRRKLKPKKQITRTRTKSKLKKQSRNKL